jgi:hypothetical protein
MEQSTRPSLVVTPHKGIRYAFAQLIMKAGNLDYTDKAQVADLKSQLDEFGGLLEEHAHLENEFILKSLEQRVPGSADHDEQDHVALEALQVEVLAKLEAILDPRLSDTKARAMGYAFYQDLGKLYAAHLEHMLEEETVTQPLLWKHFSDMEIIGLHVQIVRSIPPEVMLSWAKYLIPALNLNERIELLAGIQAGAPPAFFEQVMAIAKKTLPTPDVLKLESKLMIAAF